MLYNNFPKLYDFTEEEGLALAISLEPYLVAKMGPAEKFMTAHRRVVIALQKHQLTYGPHIRHSEVYHHLDAFGAAYGKLDRWLRNSKPSRVTLERAALDLEIDNRPAQYVRQEAPIYMEEFRGIAGYVYLKLF